MRWPWSKPRTKPRRGQRAWSKRLNRILNAEETYVFGGLFLISVGVGVMATAAFSVTAGIGASFAAMGAGSFGVGMWMLTPSRSN